MLFKAIKSLVMCFLLISSAAFAMDSLKEKVDKKYEGIKNSLTSLIEDQVEYHEYMAQLIEENGQDSGKFRQICGISEPIEQKFTAYHQAKTNTNSDSKADLVNKTDEDEIDQTEDDLLASFTEVHREKANFYKELIGILQNNDPNMRKISFIYYNALMDRERHKNSLEAERQFLQEKIKLSEEEIEQYYPSKILISENEFFTILINRIEEEVTGNYYTTGAALKRVIVDQFEHQLKERKKIQI